MAVRTVFSWPIWACAIVLCLLCLRVKPSELIVSIHRAGNSKLSLQSEGVTEPISFDSSGGETMSSLFVADSKIETQDRGHNSVCTNNICNDIDSDKNLKDAGATKMNSTLISISKASATVYSLISAGLVGLSGIFPLLVLPNMEKGGASLREGKGAKNLNRLLSFAVGGLLGDVFLHLLPESWNYLEHTDSNGNHSHIPAMTNGLWILFGLISFCFLEKLFPDSESDSNSDSEDKTHSKPVNAANNTNENNNKSPNGNCAHSNYQNAVTRKNGIVKDLPNGVSPVQEVEKAPQQKIKISGYLNLFANCIDNFTHGLAIGGSYLVSIRVGLLTTMAILLHEIPHEVGDFAILLRAGFDRWNAAKLQVLTATGGILGALFALMADSAKGAGDRVAWILPFTSGGFIYIALCTVVPDLLKETSLRESCIQMLLLISAIAIMALVSVIG